MLSPRIVVVLLCVLSAAASLLISLHIFYASDPGLKIVQTCQDPKGGSGLQECVQNILTQRVAKNGLPDGMKTLRQIYEHSTTLRPVCDLITRAMGKNVEQLGVNYTEITYTPESVWCNYGFYHGYVGALMDAAHDAQKGFAMCGYVGERLQVSAPGARPECIRAVGYGIADIIGATIKDPKEIARKGIVQCAAGGSNARDNYDCLQGVFAELGRMVATGEYGPVDQNNFFSLCKTQTKDIRIICDGTFKWLPFIQLNVRQLDVPHGYAQLEKIYGPKELDSQYNLVLQIIYTLSYTDALVGTASSTAAYGVAIANCQSIPSQYMQPCINGYALGLAKDGLPNSQYHEVVAFCQKAILASYPAEQCARDAITYLKLIYSPNILQSACAEFQKKLGVSC